MTDEEAAAIQARAEAATPGPWKWQPFDSIIAPSVGLYVVKGSGSGVVDDDDAVFIAQAREAIPALLAERAALMEVVRAVADAAVGEWNQCTLGCAPVWDGVTWRHNPDCTVMQARALLGEGERQP